jgi:hypothetical protein
VNRCAAETFTRLTYEILAVPGRLESLLETGERI